MENEFVAKILQDVDDDIFVQLFLETSTAMEGELTNNVSCRRQECAIMEQD